MNRKPFWKFSNRPSTRPPLNEPPLPNPGESTEKYIQTFLDDRIFSYLLFCLLTVFLALWEWWAWYQNLPRQPELYFLMAAVIVPFAIFRILQNRKKLKALQLGLEGEIAVGQLLETLRESGARVFHDIPGPGFNLDHVLVSPKGVFVIETKTWSKPVRGATIITFNGEGVSKNGGPYDPAPVVQVTAAANWLREMLLEFTEQDYPIQPIVVFPGWYIQPTAESKSHPVWVLNHKAVPGFIVNSRNQLSTEEVHMISVYLSRYVRTLSPQTKGGAL